MSLLKQKQRNQFDCCLATAASIAGLNYDQVFSPEFQKEIEDAKGTYGPKVDLVFQMVGITNYKHVINYLGPGMSFYDNLLAQTFEHMLWGRRAMLQMPSLNNEGKSHLIAWYYDEIWDPSNLNVYTTIKNTCPEHLWLINENPNSQ